MNRRNFIGAIGLPAVSIAGARLEAATLARFREEIASYPESVSPEEAAKDEDFWFKVQQAFTVDRTIVNLNNGGVSPAPRVAQESMARYLDYSNTAPVYTMWRILEPQREVVRTRLAETFGCDREEIAVTRNASESLQICQLGFDLQPGDELLTTNQDYPRMITTWQQRERREGIVLKQFSIPVPAEDPEEVVSLFQQNISSRTKLILMCHVINLTGQILPVKEVVQMARARGIPVIVDGAHSFGQFDFTREDLDCDYFSTSLHKWLFAPHGTGMLYVKKDAIPGLWPMMAAPETMDSDIRKFEEIGTHPAANFLAIGDALTFQEGMGLERKAARLRYLTRHWAEQLTPFPSVKLHTSLDPRFSCGIANVQILGTDSGQLTGYLWTQHKILVTPIKHPEFEGIRVTPSVYTTLEELDRFCGAMTDVIQKGIPS